MNGLTPAQLVHELDRYIVNQVDAKRALAVAMRNRMRRQRIEPALGTLSQTPHILLSGPSGVGKTTLARRAAEITDAPLIRVDVAWLQERDGVGRSIQQIVSDLVEIALRRRATGSSATRANRRMMHRTGRSQAVQSEHAGGGRRRSRQSDRESDGGGARQAPVIGPSHDNRVEAAISEVERLGIVLLDDIDRLAPREHGDHLDMSGEVIQRALIPVLDGAEVVTEEFGPVRTEHLLFIATGAFSTVRTSDLIPEFLGRFPVRAELATLDADDFERILSAPERSLRDHYVALMAADSIEIVFEPEALTEIARLSAELNQRGEDLGARRLVHVIEQVLEDLSFADAPSSDVCRINVELVLKTAGDLAEEQDLDQFIL